jgi:hypothetical protein
MPSSTGRVRCIVSGNRAREVMAAQPHRRAALDGRLDDLATDAPADLIPLVSDNWAKFFTRGAGTGTSPPPTRDAAPSNSSRRPMRSTGSCVSGTRRTGPKCGASCAPPGWMSSARMISRPCAGFLDAR